MNEAFWDIVAEEARIDLVVARGMAVEAQTDLLVARGMAVVELAELNAQLDAA